MKKYIFLNLAGLILIITGLSFLSTNKDLIQDLPLINRLPISSYMTSNTASSVSNPIPVEIDTYQGQLVDIKDDRLDIKLGSDIKTFNIAQTKDFQGVTFGSLKDGTAVTVNSSKSDLKVGKELFLLTDKGTNNASTVYIFR